MNDSYIKIDTLTVKQKLQAKLEEIQATRDNEWVKVIGLLKASYAKWRWYLPWRRPRTITDDEAREIHYRGCDYFGNPDNFLFWEESEYLGLLILAESSVDGFVYLSASDLQLIK